MQFNIKSSLFTAIFIWLSFFIEAQTPISTLQSEQRLERGIDVGPPVITDKRCASVEMHKWRQAQYPKSILDDQQFEAWVSSEIQKRKKNSAKNAVITIPIIFHIIHPNQAPGTGDNIGTNYVNAQIVQLNNDFRKIAGTSGDNNNPVGADTEIEFCPAEIDPQGNTLAEPGINRISTTSQGFTNPPYGTGYVDGTIKPATIWNPNDYCNVWVCRLSGGILGYAQFPSNSGLGGMPANGGAANTDGVVCTSTSIGSTTLPFPGGAPYNQGRTLTHEIGHWVGLRHIWGDAGCGVDDFCNDTPTSDASNFGCPNGHTSCGSIDQIENYMDYTDDFCMNIFTQDQKTRIQTVMSVSPRRASLGNSNACSNACGSLTIATNSTPADCNNNGTAGVTVNGATPPINYLWNTSATTANINNLAPGSYTVTVSDGSGCSLIESVNVLSICTEVCDTLMNFLDGIHTPTLTASNSSGYISGHNNYGDIAKADYFDYAGGVHSHIKGAYLGIGFVTAGSTLSTFNVSVWSGGPAGPIGAPLFQMPVSYTSMQTIFTANGNQPFIHYFEFPNFVAMPAGRQFYVGIDFIYGAGDAIALTHTANSQVIPSTAWEQHSDLTWHSYTETPASWGFNVAHLIWPVIGTPPTPTITPLNPSVCENIGINFNCSGNNITDVEWIFPGGTPASSTNPSVTVSYPVPGNYNVLHIARNGCMIDTTELVNYVTINQCGCNVNPTTSFTEPNCNAGCDGTATVTPGSGVPPYTYVWDGAAAGQPNQTATGLCQGTYNATATDANGCYSIVSITVSEPAGMTSSATVNSDVSCGGGSDGNATVTANGGSMPYSYNWSSGEMTQTAMNLMTGMQTVTVTDNNGCTVLDTVTLTEPIPITVSTSIGQQPTCGASNGVVNVQGSGGMPPLSYLWSTGDVTTIVIGLAAGTYTVTVTDNMGCSMVGSVTLVSPGGVSGVTSVIQNISCNGGNDGSATVNPSGGTPPYTYSWATVPVQTTQTAINLPFGNTNVTLSDATGCAQTLTVTITQPTGVQGSATVVSNGSCSGQNDGVATATGSGGTPGYTYQWNDPGNTMNATVSNLAPGAWQVTITDTNGCSTTAAVNINNVPGVNASAQTVGNASCGGGADGSVAVNATGGTPGFMYVWDDANAQTTQTATGLTAGTYTVTVTDTNGCTATSQASVSEPGTISTTVVTLQNANCGVANGALQCAAGGGAGGFTYIWDTGATTANLFGVMAGTYVVTVTDFNGCSVTDSGVVGTIGGPVLTTTSTVETCNTGNGTATVNGVGGPTPYTYLWDAAAANQTTQTAVNLSSGTYSVSVTDGNSCQVVTTVTVTDNCGSCNMTVSTTTNNESCNNLCDGSITATPASGTGPFTYLWSDGQITQTASGLCLGTYDVTVTDAASCAVVSNGTVSGPSLLSAATSPMNPACGSANGSITATSTGGTLPYTYTWDAAANGQTTPTATGLAAGTYIVTVEDNNGCTAIVSTTIASPGGPTATVSSTNATCGSNNGSATATPAGGTPPYTYNWNNGQTVQTAINLAAGSYSVTITDSNNCPIVETVSVTSTGGPAGTVSSTNATCGNNNGTATATPQGGTMPYTYNWNDGQTVQTAINLGAGAYMVTITDGNNCTVVVSGTVSSTAGPTGTVSTTNATCGSNNGTATATPQGGMMPYTYAWNDGQTVQTAINLGAGTYMVSITDSNNCTTVVSGNVSSTGGPTVTVASTNATCGNTNGTATATPIGGSMPFTYNWNDGQTTPTAINLGAGSYTVTVTDTNNCVAIQTTTVSTTAGPSLTTTTSNATCGANNGSATANPTGGTMPYTYNWSAAGQTTQTAINLGAGSYMVTVTDSNNCTAVETVTVASTNGPTITSTSVDATCGNSNGTATANPAGGMPGYTYIWDNGQTAQTAINLAAGSYMVTVLDMNNCSVVTTVVVNNIGGPSATTSSTGATCAGSDGTATITPAGGTIPYTYLWDATTGGQTAQVAINLVPGVYSVTVTDDNGCTAAQQVTVSDACVCNVMATISSSNTTCAGSDGSATANPTGGTTPYTYLWDAAAGNQTAQTAVGLNVGGYSVTITDAFGCSVVQQATILDGCVCNVSAFVTVVNTTCAGSDGSATATPTGGTMPYTYLWDANANNQTTQTAINLPVGAYVVTTTDANGCTAINQIAVLDGCVCNVIGTISSTSTSCAANDGTATINVTGGLPPFTYLWDAAAGNQMTQIATGLVIGGYAVTATDANGCSVVQQVTVTDGCVCNVQGTSVTTFESCFGNDGTATASAAGGTGPYTYQWDVSAGNQTTPTATGLTAGNYSVVITDAFGCNTTILVTITNNCSCNIAVTIGNTGTTCGDATGSASATAGGGVPPFTFLWNNAAVTQTINNLTAGTYTVTVTDSGGCSQIQSTTIIDGGVLSAQVVGTSLACNGDNSGSATVTNPGTFTYQWSTGQNTASINNLPAGTYMVTVTSGTCVDVVSVTVNEPAALAVTVQSANSQCSANDGTASALGTGGTSPYTYLWNTGATMPTIGGLATGVYTVTITDTNGCVTIGSGSVTSAANGPALSALQTNVTCNGSNDGAIDLTVTNGTGPFTYDWNGLNVEDLSGLAPGNYTCVVTDVNNCIAVITVSITEPAPMTLSWYTTPPGPTNDMGSAGVNVSGGTPGYTYQWSDGQTTQLATGLATGTYTVIIIDANGCTTTGTVGIWNPTSAEEIESLALFELFPNPSNGQFTVNLEFNQVEDLEFNIYTLLGQQLLNVSLRGSSFYIPVDVSYAAAGTYVVSIKSKDGGEVVKRFIIAD